MDSEYKTALYHKEYLKALLQDKHKQGETMLFGWVVLCTQDKVAYWKHSHTGVVIEHDILEHETSFEAYLWGSSLKANQLTDIETYHDRLDGHIARRLFIATLKITPKAQP